MKGKIESTIPQRQFENIKTSYEFTNEEEREIAIKMIIKDCLDLKDIVTKTHKATSEPIILKKHIKNGILYRDVLLEGEVTVKEKYDKEQNKWIRI